MEHVVEHPWKKDSALAEATSPAFLGTKQESGYGHPLYAQSFAEFGRPIAMDACGGWFLKRPIPNSTDYDGMGCYPMFSCTDWKQLGTAVQMLEGSLASFAAVLDPFGDYDLALLKETFSDLVLPFKSHFVIDLTGDCEAGICAHHRRNIRKSCRHVRIEISEAPDVWLNDWVALYDNLIARHQINGLRAFSRCCFSWQLRVPGIVALRATVDGELAGMQLWYRQGTVAHYHLGACNARGYEFMASYALLWNAIEYFSKRGLKWLNLGAGAGLADDGQDGLTRFKRGWSPRTRTAYFCGRILNREAYDSLTRPNGNVHAIYFPAYRHGEFCKMESRETPALTH